MLAGTKWSSEEKMRTLFGNCQRKQLRRKKIQRRDQRNRRALSKRSAELSDGRLSMFPAAFHLKQKLQSELHLPRRAGIAVGKSVLLILPKFGCHHSPGWRSGMMKSIEHSARIASASLIELDVLSKEKSDVLKPGPINHIAAEIAEARDRSKGRGIEPALTLRYQHRPATSGRSVLHPIDRAVLE